MKKQALDPQLQKTRDDIAGYVSDMISKIQQIFARPDLSHAQKTQAVTPLVTDGQKNIDKALSDSAAWQKLTLTAPTAPATPAAPQLTINTGVGTNASIKPGLSKRALKGGKGEGVSEDLMDKRELEVGEKVEMEHTDDPEIAHQIAKDHLAEQIEQGKDKDKQDYYKNLVKYVDPEHKEDMARDGVPNPFRKNLDYGER